MMLRLPPASYPAPWALRGDNQPRLWSVLSAGTKDLKYWLG